jgi:hypothetical protein
MQHHGPCDGHDCSNVSLSNTIVMVSANTSESNDLLEVREVARKLDRRERF